MKKTITISTIVLLVCLVVSAYISQQDKTPKNTSWSTFDNNSGYYGYTFTHPSDWEIEEYEGVLIFNTKLNSNKNDAYDYQIITDSRSPAYESYVNDYVKFGGATITNEYEFTVSGYKATFFEFNRQQPGSPAEFSASVLIQNVPVNPPTQESETTAQSLGNVRFLLTTTNSKELKQSDIDTLIKIVQSVKFKY